MYIPKEQRTACSEERMEVLENMINNFYLNNTVPSYSNLRGFLDVSRKMCGQSNLYYIRGLFLYSFFNRQPITLYTNLAYYNIKGMFFLILCPMFQTTSLDLKFVIQLCSILERVSVIKECICTNVYNNIWLIVLTNVPYTIFRLQHC